MPPGLASELGPEFLTGPSTSHLRTPSAMSAFGQKRTRGEGGPVYCILSNSVWCGVVLAG